MATSAKYARRRRNAFLAAVALALLLILIIVLIIVSIAKRSNGNNNGAVPTVTPGNNLALPTPTNDFTINSEEPGTVTPSPSNAADDNTMYVTASTLNVREKAESGAKIITTVKKGDSVTVLEKGDKFHKIKTSSGQTGYASKDYLTTTKPSDSSTVTATAGATPDTSKSTVKYATADVNVRKAADVKSDRLTQIKKGSKVTAYTTSNGWTYVEYQKGKFGYVSDKYLTATLPTASPTPSAGTATPSPTPAHATSLVDIVGKDAAAEIGEVPPAYLNITKAGQGLVTPSTIGGYKVYPIATTTGGTYYIGIKDGTPKFTTTLSDFN